MTGGNMHPYTIDTNERIYTIFFIAIVSILLSYYINFKLIQLDIAFPWWAESPSVLFLFWLLYSLYDNVLWKFFSTIGLSKIPIIDGNWHCTGYSSYDNYKFESKVSVKQRWSKIRITFRGDFSYSYSIAASILLNAPDSDLPLLIYVYWNIPNPDAKRTMHPHRGTTILFLSDEYLEGEYYSGRDRQNYGKIRLEKEKSNSKNHSFLVT